MKKIDLNYFPGWTRKAVSFTIDDGNVAMDRKFIGIIQKSRIKGTFNLTSNFALEHDDGQTLRRLYAGYEIANHVKYHPFAFRDGETPANVTTEIFPGAEQADPAKTYALNVPGLYRRYNREDAAWQVTATAETYIHLTENGKQELEEVFGQGTVRGFVWPYSRQENTKVIEYLKTQYATLRTAGVRFGYEETAFDLPDDWSNWTINTRHKNLMERGAQFERLADDTRLKWLVFGVHSADFERDGTWNELEQFCAQYGHRQEFWYASNFEIYRYAMAITDVCIQGDSITNPTDQTLYIEVDGAQVKLKPQSTIII